LRSFNAFEEFIQLLLVTVVSLRIFSLGCPCLNGSLKDLLGLLVPAVVVPKLSNILHQLNIVKLQF
jgi:hypothetical protein